MERGKDEGQGKRFWRQHHASQLQQASRSPRASRLQQADQSRQASRSPRASRPYQADQSHQTSWSQRASRPPRAFRPHQASRPYSGECVGEDTEDRGIEIIYGRHPVNELMHSGRPVQRLHVLANAQGIPKDIFTLARERAIPVVHTDRERLDYLCNHANHQGVVAEAGGGQFAEAAEVMERPLLAGECPFFLVLDGVQDPGNFGAILRSAEAAGVHGVFVAGDSSCGLTGTVSKASAGADQYVPVARVPKLSGLLRIFRENGYVIAGTEVEGSVPYTEVNYTRPTVIVMGAEEAGLRPSVREQCTALVRLPMRGKVQSLNVSAATAVVLYEVLRQR